MEMYVKNALTSNMLKRPSFVNGFGKISFIP